MKVFNSTYIFLFTSILPLLPWLTSAEIIKGRGIGEPCTCDNDCDFSKWLTCQNGFCSCLKSRAFVYDYIKETCVVRLGQKCFEIAQEYSEYNTVDLPPIIRCIDGAFCSISAGGLCSCNSYGFYESTDGTTCLAKRNYAEPCQRAIECRSEVCSGMEGQCICKIGEFYHKKRKKCVGLIGALCFSDDECTDNAICRDYDVRCVCRPGYSEMQTKTCEIKLKYGDACSTGSPCNNVQLSCINGACDCKYDQEFDNETGNCLSFVAGPCNYNDDCMKNSHCALSGMFKECQCDESYLEMESGRCVKFSGYGVACESSSECDPIPPLVCKDSRCDCRHAEKIYDRRRRLCVGLVGSKCSSSSIRNACVENAICVQLNPQLPGKCLCDLRSGFKSTGDRSCVLEN